MRVETAKQATFGQPGGTPRDATLAPVEQDSGSRALVVQAPLAAPAPSTIQRQSVFLAHLIAVKDQHPQTRERRRAEPGEAIAAYRAVQALVS